MAQAKERPKPRTRSSVFLSSETKRKRLRRRLRRFFRVVLLHVARNWGYSGKLWVLKMFAQLRFERQHWKPFCSIQENIYKIGNVIFIFYDQSDPRRDSHKRRKALGPGAKVHAHVNRDINSCSWFALSDDVARDLTRDLLLKPSCGTQALHQRGLHLSTWTIQTSLVGYKGGWFMMRHKRSVCADSRE